MITKNVVGVLAKLDKVEKLYLNQYVSQKLGNPRLDKMVWDWTSRKMKHGNLFSAFANDFMAINIRDLKNLNKNGYLGG